MKHLAFVLNRLIAVHYGAVLVADGEVVTRSDDPRRLDGLPDRPAAPHRDIVVITSNYISKRN